MQRLTPPASSETAEPEILLARNVDLAAFVGSGTALASQQPQPRATEMATEGSRRIDSFFKVVKPSVQVERAIAPAEDITPKEPEPPITRRPSTHGNALVSKSVVSAPKHEISEISTRLSTLPKDVPVGQLLRQKRGEIETETPTASKQQRFLSSLSSTA